MTKQNADNAGQTRAMMQEASQIIEKVNRHMEVVDNKMLDNYAKLFLFYSNSERRFRTGFKPV